MLLSYSLYVHAVFLRWKRQKKINTIDVPLRLTEGGQGCSIQETL